LKRRQFTELVESFFGNFVHKGVLGLKEHLVNRVRGWLTRGYIRALMGV